MSARPVIKTSTMAADMQEAAIQASDNVEDPTHTRCFVNIDLEPDILFVPVLGSCITQLSGCIIFFLGMTFAKELQMIFVDPYCSVFLLKHRLLRTQFETTTWRRKLPTLSRPPSHISIRPCKLTSIVINPSNSAGGCFGTKNVS